MRAPVREPAKQPNQTSGRRRRREGTKSYIKTHVYIAGVVIVIFDISSGMSAGRRLAFGS
jgi:hypothetical protein